MARFAWGLGSAAAIVNALGYALSLYRLPWFDEAVHGFTLFALTVLAAWLLRGQLPSTRHAVAFVAIVTVFGLGLGALWEIAEWVYDSFSAGDTIRGKQDTMTDLVLDTAGALAAALLLMFEGQRQSS